MSTYLRIICIWICCVSCLFGLTQLPTVQGVPFEYIEDHEQLSDDMDTEQSKAKYDTRLLSKQLLKDSASSFESYDERTDSAGAAEDDLQPHERAASCYTGDRKYTHGQKVPRQDPCEVCLCMDGEIFCWWEKCVKKRQKVQPTAYTPPSQQQTEPLQQTAKNTASHAIQSVAHMSRDFPKKHEKKHTKKQQKLHTTILYKNKKLPQQRKHEQQSNEQQSQQHQQQNQQLQHVQKPAEQRHKHKHEHEHDFEHLSSASSSKIFSFPENLPSVLYYDYRTEEHQHHQSQHRQQHLKHQQQLLLQHKQKHRQQPPKYNPYGSESTSTATPSPSYVSTGNENVYEDSETDSDILPEPPTKRPKATPKPTLRANTTSAPAQGPSTDDALLGTLTASDGGGFDQEHSNGSKQILVGVAATTTSSSTPTQQKDAIDQPLKTLQNEQQTTKAQDDAFHRWLTSSEPNTLKTFNSSSLKDTPILNVTSIAITVDRASKKNQSESFFHNSYSDYGNDFNESVVNIDILLTAGDEHQRQQPQPRRKEQIQEESIILEADLISNPSQKGSLATTKATTAVTGSNASASTIAAMAASELGGGRQSSTTVAFMAEEVTTTVSPERQCNVMGTLYKIGDVLPQDTGNCLQCVCIDGSSSDNTPRVTCSPHNCPPLVLPDLFDATGY